MAQNRSRASSSANQRPKATNASPKPSPKRYQQQQQRPRRGSSQAASSPTVTPARAVRVANDNGEIGKSTRTPEPRGDVGMTPAERYYKNLRVLRRRDPHIVSIFDQFAHVTVYYMVDDMNMERAGYEGTLFFFERDIEPRYGLFILNRQGMNDYIRYLLHDDLFEVVGEAVWISTLSPTSQNAMGDEDKTTGFWTLASDARETLGDMMTRLASYIRRGERYPDEFRYGPDRIVPQQNYVAGGNRDEVKHDFLRDLPDGMREKIIRTVQTAKAKAQAEDAENERRQNDIPGSESLPSVQSNLSELDQLFSKLAASEAPPPDPTPPAPPPAQLPLSGKALLDSMFASVATPPSQPSTAGQKLTLQQLGLAPPVSSPPENMEILSPKPSAAGLPQILTTDVIDELMGFPSSDSRSASRSSASASNVGHPRSPSSAGAHRSKERGYVADFGEDDGGTSEASTNVDPDMQTSESILERLLPGARTTFLSAGSNTSTGSLKGDATPRARTEQLGHTSPSVKSPPDVTHTVSAGAVPAMNKKGPVQPNQVSRTVSAPSTVRIPFQSGVELWPSSESSSAELMSVAGDSNEVVELDFSEIGALDDMRAFEAKAQSPARGRETKFKEKVKANGTSAMPNGVHAKGPRSSAADKGVNVKGPRERNGVNLPTNVPQIVTPTDARQDVVGRSLRSALVASNLLTADGQTLSRNAFVREVLTLIHTDSKFVDKLYQAYQDTVSSST
ncbi:hypothetical protein ACEPAH_2084 [Sanghuangporus vaninii]